MMLGGFGRAFGNPRRWPDPRKHMQQAEAAFRPFVTGAAFTSLGGAVGNFVRLGSATLLLGAGGTVLAVNSQKAPPHPGSEPDTVLSVPWVAAIAAEKEKEEVLSPGQMLRKHPLGLVLLEQDHLFEAMIQSGQISELRCFYDNTKREFCSIVDLGKNVCGYPHTTHGGLTAALLDETFGGLAVCLWKSGALGMQAPAYTARLEVDYKKKVPAGALILINTELLKIEGRKIWMQASVTDGKGQVFASARALFVSPQVQSLTRGWFSWLPFGGGSGSGAPKKVADPMVEVRAPKPAAASS